MELGQDADLWAPGVDYLNPYTEAWERFTKRYGVLPNAFLVAPDRLRELHERNTSEAWHAFMRHDPDPPPRPTIHGCAIYVITLPPGTILAALVQKPPD
jgi:hypothetical protein